MKSSPNILVFACNWDGLSCVEAAAQAGLTYPASVNIVRVSCISRVHAGLILKSFDLGAEGVMVLGCEPGKCHFNIEHNSISGECEKAREVLKLLGMEEDRLAFSYLGPANGQGFVRLLAGFMSRIERM